VPKIGERLEHQRQQWQPGLWARIIGLGVIGAYLLGFIVANTRSVHVRFIFATATVSLIWVVLLCLGIGLVAGVLMAQLHRRRSRQ
jgi:uncharacterized integral membrane protein